MSPKKTQHVVTEGTRPTVGNNGGRLISQSDSVPENERTLEREKTKRYMEVRDQARSPMIRCLSLIKAFQNKLANGNSEASGTLADS